MELLTKLERKMFAFMESYIAEHSGDAPTLAEIGSACGVKSVGTVHRYLSSMQEKGCVRKSRSGWRTRRPKTEGETMSDATLHTDCTCCEHAAKEISRRKEELKEAREIIQQLLGHPFGASDRARAFLDRGE